MSRDQLILLAVAVVLLALLATLIFVLLRHRTPQPAGRHRPHRDDFRSEEDRARQPLKRVAVVVNPHKVSDLEAFQARVAAVCLAHGWAEPALLPTTAEDTGTGSALQAVADGVDVVCVLGGDGTIRSVAQGLAGTRTPMGLLPSGTGNLLARNLGLPLTGLEEAVGTALSGHNERVDVGRLTVDPAGDGAAPVEHVFLVMAGMGLDAAIMGGAPEDLKAKVGWPAYVLSGLRNLRGDRFRVSLTMGGEGHEQTLEVRTRTVVVGNCGKLPAGITLMPEARIDDGLLDCVVISPKTLAGWVAVISRVVRRTTTRNDRVVHYASTRFVVRPDKPQEVQLDGDPIGEAHAITTEVWPKALIVRMPATTSPLATAR